MTHEHLVNSQPTFQLLSRPVTWPISLLCIRLAPAPVGSTSASYPATSELGRLEAGFLPFQHSPWLLHCYLRPCESLPSVSPQSSPFTWQQLPIRQNCVGPSDPSRLLHATRPHPNATALHLVVVTRRTRDRVVGPLHTAIRPNRRTPSERRLKFLAHVCLTAAIARVPLNWMRRV